IYSNYLLQQWETALADAAAEPWVCGPSGGSYHRIELDACHRAGFEPRIVHRALDWSAYLAIVGSGLGVALLPGLAIRADGATAAVRLTDTPRQSRRVLTCVRRGSGRHPAIHRLREALRRARDIAAPHP
ncbi:MAG: LysR substrate-binding domain-containing protein, partial [Pseudonocardia sp.]|nr:LysR substrate-binding domain-containing protein [Pseudonocardia sp.]